MAKTTFERCKGKKAKTLGIKFGESVLWKRKLVGGALGKLTVTLEDGVYLGVKGKTGEIVVATEDGVWKARNIQRKPADDRWRKESVDTIMLTPSSLGRGACRPTTRTWTDRCRL